MQTIDSIRHQLILNGINEVDAKELSEKIFELNYSKGLTLSVDQIIKILRPNILLEDNLQLLLDRLEPIKEKTLDLFTDKKSKHNKARQLRFKAKHK